MSSSASVHGALTQLGGFAGAWLASWWRVVRFAALLLALVLSPSSHSPPNRRALMQHLVVGTLQPLLGFTIVCTLINLVLVRIVLVTSFSYGLSQYALEMVVRVLMLELIPLTAALFAALRCTIPNAVEIASLPPGRHLLVQEVLPRVAAGVFCALMLAAVSCVVTLVVAYLSVYGLTASGFAAYTHTVGQVFDGAVSLVFGLKIVLLGVAVALLPAATVLDPALRDRSKTSAELRGLVRMFLVILLIEAASLVGNYY